MGAFHPRQIKEGISQPENVGLVQPFLHTRLVKTPLRLGELAADGGKFGTEQAVTAAVRPIAMFLRTWLDTCCI